MQNRLLNQLQKINTFSAQLTQILEKISKHFSTIYDNMNTHNNAVSKIESTPIIKQMEHYLVSLCCQNKNLLHYKYLDNKINNEHCLAHTVDILSYLTKIFQQSDQTIVSIFLTHITSHSSCYISYYSFLMLLEGCPQLINEVSYEKLSQINLKLQKQQNVCESIKMLHSIQLDYHQVFNKQHLQICDRNLNNYLLNKMKPPRQTNKNAKQRREVLVSKPTSIKIPPLALPTSKSINSERFLTVSKQEQKNGFPEFCRLATNLGQNFVTVELGCLLSNKRTRQVQQFSENQTFRQQCIEKIEKIHTQRMNSSRISMNVSGNQNSDFEPKDFNPSSEQLSKVYYRRVLEANLNLFLMKVSKVDPRTTLSQNQAINIIDQQKTAEQQKFKIKYLSSFDIVLKTNY